MAPSDLVSGIAGDVQSELNTVFNLDDHLGGEGAADEGDATSSQDPVTITVDEEPTDEE
jgi:hypothetical protein